MAETAGQSSKFPLDALGQPHPADLGDVDIEAIKANLTLTPVERLRKHEQALRSVQSLREAGDRFYSSHPNATQPPPAT